MGGYMAQQIRRFLPRFLIALLIVLGATSAQSQDFCGNEGSVIRFNSAPSQNYVSLARFELAAEPNGNAAIFQDHCTACHDAGRSLTKKKSLADWRITVRKMAEKPDADIPEGVREPIAQYLAAHAG